MSQFKISWHGPFNFRSSKGDDGIPDFVEGENYKKVQGNDGVYAFVYETDKGPAINYIGSVYNGKGFNQRLLTHLRDYMSYQYRQIDMNDLRKGKQTSKNVGWMNMLYSMELTSEQNTLLPDTTIKKLEDGYRFGRIERSRLLGQLEKSNEMNEICIQNLEAYNTFKRMFESGKSIDAFLRNKNSDNEFKIYFTEIKNRLKKIYINNFEKTGAKKDGIDFCKEILIYLAPLTENIRDAERIIHTSICHHPVQWVREFISYHLTSRDSLGKSRYPLEMLSMKMGIDYTKSTDSSVPTFRKK